MPLLPSSSRVRVYRGRSAEFADAMARAEQKANPKIEAPLWVGRTRRGSLKHRDGRLVQPGPLFDPQTFNELPLID